MPTTPRRVSGPAGYLDRTTDDGRRIAAAGFTSRQVPLPLLALRRQPDRYGHDGAELVGRLTEVTVLDGVIHVVGEVTDGTIPAGTYPCGVDLVEVTNVLLSAASGEPLTSEAVDGLLDAADPLAIISEAEASELIAVTMYVGGGVGAFPDARLTVEPTAAPDSV